MQTQIKLLLQEQSDQGLHDSIFNLHILEAFLRCKIKLFHFKDNYGNCFSYSFLFLRTETA